MRKPRTRGRSTGTSVVTKPLDAERAAEITPMAPSSQGGGSTLGLVVEGSYIFPPAPAYVASPFGRNYISKRPSGLVSGDINLRMQVWSYNVTGYHQYGSDISSLEGYKDIARLLLDWYSYARDMGKRSKLYKHTPVNLTTYTNILAWYLEVWAICVMNVGTLLNVNRMLMYSPAIRAAFPFMPRYVSRLARLWQRLSVYPIPNFVRGHALRNTPLVGADPLLVPTIRFWSPWILKAWMAENGPVNTNQPDLISVVTMDNTKFGVFVENLENMELWLRASGTATINADFVAMRDAMDMMADVVPGSFAQGLPNARDLPGMVSDPGLLTDILYRGIGYKDDLTTDRWIPYPVAGATAFGGRYPVIGINSPQDLYNFIGYGAPKFISFSVGTTKYADVNTDCVIYGSDIPMLSTLNMDITVAGFFGDLSTPREQAVTNSGVTVDLGIQKDQSVALQVRNAEEDDSIENLHAFRRARYFDRDSVSDAVYGRIVEEAKSAYVFYADPEDIGPNTALYVAKNLGIPYQGVY